MKIFILGGYGEVGAPTAKLLAESTMVTNITIAGRNLKRAEKLAAEIGDKAEAVKVNNGFDEQELTALLAGYDLVVNAAPRDSIIPTIKAAIRNKINYCDPSGPTIHKKARQLSSEAEAAGITAILAAGVSPCISNLMGVHAARQLDEVKQFQVGMVELINLDTKAELNPKHKLWQEDPKIILNALKDYKPFLNWMFQRLQDHGSKAVISRKDLMWVEIDPVKAGVEVPLIKGGHTTAYPYFSGNDDWGMTPIEIAKEKPVDMWFSPFSPQLDAVLREQALSVLRGEKNAEKAINTLYETIADDPSRWLTPPEDFFQIPKMWISAVGEKQGKSAHAYCWFTSPMWHIDGYFLTSVALAAAARMILRGEVQKSGVIIAENAFELHLFLNEVSALLPKQLQEGKIIGESFEWLE